MKQRSCAATARLVPSAPQRAEPPELAACFAFARDVVGDASVRQSFRADAARFLAQHGRSIVKGRGFN